MKITVLTWCVSFLPILLLIMLLAIFVYNDHPVVLCKGLAPPPNRECRCSIRVYSFPLYGILCPYSTPSLDAAFAERIVIFAPPLFLSGIPDISSKSNPVI